MCITFKNINPKMYDQCNLILDGYIMLNNILLKMDDQYNPILDVYYIQKYPSKNGWQIQSNFG